MAGPTARSLATVALPLCAATGREYKDLEALALSPYPRFDKPARVTEMGQYPWAEVFLFEILHNSILYPTRHHAYRVVLLAAAVYLAVRIFLTPEVTYPLATTHSVGCAIASKFMFMVYLLFTEGSFPDHWRRVRDEVNVKADAGGLEKLPSNFPLTKKLWWMVDITYSVRMIGWVQEPRDCMPPHPPPSRRTFLWKTFLKFIMNTTTADIMISALALTPAFDHRLHDPTDGPETYLAAVPFFRRIPYTLAWGIGTGASIGAMHNALALVCVGLGHSNPTLWPDICGRWGDAYTVRKIWGRTWHQQLRPMLVGFGRLIANKFLKFPRGTNRSSYTQLYVVFFLSGLVHFGGDFIVEKRMVYGSFRFSLLQAVAITFEDFVIYIAKRLLRWGGIELKPGRDDESWAEVVVRVIGYCWVTLWFCWTLPIRLDELSALGLGITDRKPITQFLVDTRKQWA